MSRKATGWMAAALFVSGVCAAQDDPAPRAKGRSRGDEGGPFRQMDTDKDGKVSKAEFEAGFAKLDKDADGFVTKEELGPAAKPARKRGGRKGQGAQEDSAREKKGGPADAIFSRLDADGKVSKAEYEAAFAKLDRDGDGFIDQKPAREGRAPGRGGRRRARP